jgi:predicted transcriptional regulator
MDERTRLAEALRLWILTNEIEQRDLAKAWKCSPSTVTRFLAGTALPEPQTILRIFQWCLEIEK